MRPESTIPFVSPAIRNGVLVLGGYGIRVSVERRHLAVSDGIGRNRRAGTFSKVAGIKRLIVLGHTGFITFEALRWLHDIRASFAQIDADGLVIVASGPPNLNDARLRRAQAQAASNGVGLRITCDLLREKLQGQAVVLDRFGVAPAAAAKLRNATDNLDGTSGFYRLRVIEAACAADYWKVWEHFPVRFARRDEARVSEYWKTFGTRSSPFTGQPRLAANPANALLNYLYGILETEARIACQAMGLDPGMGILHADQPARDSLALDVMESARPVVDAFILDVLRTRTFSKDDFTETRQGVCRVLPPLTRFLAETAPRLGRAVAPVVERVARALADKEREQRSHRPIPTPLTQGNRSAGRDRVRRHPQRVAELFTPRMAQACRNCGVLLECLEGRLYCDGCLPDRQSEQIASYGGAGRLSLIRLRREGRDPAHGGEAARARGEKVGRYNRERARWRKATEDAADSNVFRREILPRLRQIRVLQIAQTIGVSKGYASFIRRGLRIPHPRHWEPLRRIK